MDIHLISPYVRLAIPSVRKAPFHINRRVLFDYEIILLESSCWKLTVQDQVYTCNPGQVILLCPGQSHSIESIGAQIVSQPHIHFDMMYDSMSHQRYVCFKDLPSIPKAERSWIAKDIVRDTAWRGPFLRFADQERFRDLFFSVLESGRSADEENALASRANMLLLLEYIFKENFPELLGTSAKSGDPMQPIREYIDHNHYAVLNLDMLAMQFHYNKYHMEKEFSRATGLPIIRYYHMQRVSSAKKMLEGQASITEIAEQLNFRSIYAFSRFFKMQTGISPTEYRCGKMK